ncbi:MAG: acyl-CoA dehydrogenase family protein [Desulfurococcales archaeon]|nr:acyl-CoA dehydrogenase family protein [Desulfurococcales archaeon]
MSLIDVYENLDPELQVIRSTVREFARSKVAPLARKIDEENKIPDELLQEIGELGFTALRVPEEYGGPGFTLLQSVVAVEELSWASSAVGILATVSGDMVAYPIMEYGNEELKEEYLPRLAKGEIGAFALTEPCCGSDAASLTTKAVREGDEYIITGRKTFITNSPYASFFLVAARTGKPEDRHRGISLFVVDKSDCIELSKLDMMGYRGSGTSEILFNECRVPAYKRLGEEGEGFKITMMALNEGRIVTATTGLGIAQAAFDDALSYAKSRTSMGVPIIEHQMVASLIAEMSTLLEAIRGLIYGAAWLADHGHPDYIRAASMAKFAAAKWGTDIVRMALQVHGGFGFSKEARIERLYRDIKMIEIGDGTNEIQKLVITRTFLGRIKPFKKH